MNDEGHTLATWVVEEQDGHVRLRWRANASATAWMDCGGGPPAILESLIEWVFSEATHEDLIITPTGTFTKQRTPAGKPVRA